MYMNRLIRIAYSPITVKSVDFIRYVGYWSSIMYGVFVGFHVVFASEFLFANVALKFGRHVTARQLMAFQVATAFEKFKTFRTMILRANAAFFGQMKT